MNRAAGSSRISIILLWLTILVVTTHALAAQQYNNNKRVITAISTITTTAEHRKNVSVATNQLPADGTMMQLWICKPGAFNQQFTMYGGDGSIRLTNATSKCLDISDWGTAEGTIVQIYTCHVDNNGANEKWVYNKETNQIISQMDGLCLTANTNAIPTAIQNLYLGATISTWKCTDGYLNQTWYFDNKDGTIRSGLFLDLCLDVGSTFTCNDIEISEFAYCNPEIPSKKRAEDLVSRMTIQEKISQMGNSASGVARLGVPQYNWWSECNHGVQYNNPNLPVTVFPQPIGLGATFNVSGFAAIAQVTSTEARALNNAGVYGLTYFAPNINIFRDPRWGRGQETPGEDPYLTSQYVNHFVRGLQEGDDPRCTKVVATCKHFAAYSLENWNGITRYYFNALIDNKDFVETYLPAFEACVMEAQVKSIMCSYVAVNGVPSCADSFTIQTLARDNWGFEGFVVGDCDAVRFVYETHHYAPTPAASVAASLKAGVDLDCGSYYQQHLLQAFQEGFINETDLDAALVRLFKQRFDLSMAPSPSSASPSSSCSYSQIGLDQVNTPYAQRVALQAARESIVLLKNQNQILPLNNKYYQTVAVIGPHGNDTTAMLSQWSGHPPFVISPLEGIASKGVQTIYAQGCNVTCPSKDGFEQVVAIANKADVAIMLMGINYEIETEMKDRVNLSLPGFQEDLIREIVTKTNTPAILVLINGGPIALSDWVVDNVQAIVEAWYPGQSGGAAIADVLFGDYNPGGRLPVTMYRADYVDQIPMTEMNMRKYPGRTYRYLQVEPLFEFGFGLSYTTFQTKWLSSAADFPRLNSDGVLLKPNSRSNSDDRIIRISLADMRKAQSLVNLRAQVTNIGTRAGDEVVMAYVTHLDSPECAGIEHPIKQLFGFARVHLAPGESTQVFFPLFGPPRLLSHSSYGLSSVDERGNRIVCPGMKKVFIGSDANQPALYFELVGDDEPWLLFSHKRGQ